MRAGGREAHGGGRLLLRARPPPPGHSPVTCGEVWPALRRSPQGRAAGAGGWSPDALSG